MGSRCESRLEPWVPAVGKPEWGLRAKGTQGCSEILLCACKSKTASKQSNSKRKGEKTNKPYSDGADCHPSCSMQGHRKDTVPSEVGKLEQGPAWGTQGHTETHDPCQPVRHPPTQQPSLLSERTARQRREEYRRLTGTAAFPGS